MAKLEDIIGERLYYGYNQAISWRDNYIKSIKFYYGEHLTHDDKEVLEELGREFFISNNVRPLLKQLKAILTAKKPTFSAANIGSDDRDERDKVNRLFRYTYRISKGYLQFSRVIRNAILSGLGLAAVYYDPDSSDGLGDVKFKSINPLNFIGDWNSTEPDFSDMRFQIYFEYFPIETAQEILGMSRSKLLDFVTSDGLNEIIVEDEDGETMNFGRVHAANKVDEFVGIGEYYYFKKEKQKILYNTMTKEQIILGDDKDVVYPLPKYIVSAEREIKRLHKVIFLADSMQSNKVKIVKEVPYKHVNRFLIVPFILEDTENPYPVGEVKFMTGYQRWINKYYQLILEHGKRSAYHNLIVSKEEDIDDIERRRNSPNGVLGLEHPELFHELTPPPLDQTLMLAKNDIEMKLKEMVGMYDTLLGNPQAATGNYSESLIYQEKGMQRANDTMRNFESFLEGVGASVFQMYKEYYNYPRIMTFFDDQEKENVTLKLNVAGEEDSILVEHLNTDLAIVPASYMPTNEMAQAAVLKELLPFATEAYRDVIFKRIMEGIGVEDKTLNELEQTYQLVIQLQKQIQQLQEIIKEQESQITNLKSQVFTADRRVLKAQYEANLDKKYYRTSRDIDVMTEKEKMLSKQKEGESNGRESKGNEETVQE